MKAIDTNVLIRFLVEDEPVMAKTATQALYHAEQNEESFFVSLLVVLELNWVLASCYKYSRNEIIEVLSELLLMPVLSFEAPEILNELINIAQITNLDISDILIGLRAKKAGSISTLTFDKRALQSELFEEINN